jgi:alpha-ribazole phosphatase
VAVLIYLIRHGVTRLNEEKRYQGLLDEPLSPAGREMLRRADASPARVYVSPLRRAGETAAILFPQAEQVPVADLREMDFGAFDGRGWWEMEEDPAYRAWVEGGCAGTCPGGECLADFSARTCAAFAALVDRAREAGAETLAVVAHGGTQMAVLERYGRPRKPYWSWMTGPGQGYLLTDRDWPVELTPLELLDFTEGPP